MLYHNKLEFFAGKAGAIEIGLERTCFVFFFWLIFSSFEHAKPANCGPQINNFTDFYQFLLQFGQNLGNVTKNLPQQTIKILSSFTNLPTSGINFQNNNQSKFLLL